MLLIQYIYIGIFKPICTYIINILILLVVVIVISIITILFL